MLAKKDALQNLADPVPLHLRNAPTNLMRELGYGKNYEFAHDFENRITRMQCLPENLQGHEYYKPTTQGNEEIYKKRLEKIKAYKKSSPN